MHDTAQRPGADILKWKPYLVTLRLLSPMHIGWKKIGNLQQTRLYVSGRNIWGALTSRLVRDQGDSNYEAIGKIVDEELRFTYFYPSRSPENIEIWPWKNHLDIYLWNFLKSYVSISLNDKTAEDSALHETEFISPTTRKGDPVYLIGYIFEKEGCTLRWRKALEQLQIGGERGYGWGRAQINIEPKLSDKCFEHDIIEKDKSPAIKMKANECIFAHVLATGKNINGFVEPLVGRVTSESSGFGGNMSEADICWAPGGCLKKDSFFKIQPKGIWEECQD
jgi:hypothetical protein